MAARNDPVDQLHQAIIVFSRNSRVRANEMYNGMSFVAYAMLTYIGGQAEPTALELAERYQLEKSTVSRQLADLAENGLITRVPHPRQPRTKLLQLTDQGRRCLADIRAHQRKGLDERLRTWSDEDIARFAQLFHRFVDGEH